MSDATDVLESLLAHPGWALFMEHTRAEWANAGYGRKVKEALSTARSENKDAAAAVDKVDYANDRIGEVIGWPKQELARLKRLELTQDLEPPTRPHSLPNVAEMSRRGSL